jgi:hypothetical protein
VVVGVRRWFRDGHHVDCRRGESGEDDADSLADAVGSDEPGTGFVDERAAALVEAETETLWCSGPTERNIPIEHVVSLVDTSPVQQSAGLDREEVVDRDRDARWRRSGWARS